MFVHQEGPPTVTLPGGQFSLLMGNAIEPGEAMHTVGLSTAIREIRQALELARTENQPQVNIEYGRCHIFDNEALLEYRERVKLVLEHVEAEVDLVGIQANYHIRFPYKKKIIITIWIS